MVSELTFQCLHNQPVEKLSDEITNEILHEHMISSQATTCYLQKPEKVTVAVVTL